MEISILILISLLIISIYIIRNLLKKTEKQEDIILYQQKYLTNVSEVISFCDDELKKIDEKGTFKSDDEIGFFFEKIQNLQLLLNNFKIKQNV